MFCDLGDKRNVTLDSLSSACLEFRPPILCDLASSSFMYRRTRSTFDWTPSAARRWNMPLRIT